MKYTIIDQDHLITRPGNQELSIRPLTPAEIEVLKQHPTTSQWHNPSIQVYKAQHPIDLKAYFKQVNWPQRLNQWSTEGLQKDPRLVDCIKSLIIPLNGDPTQIQPLNAHSAWITNTGPGKSFFTYLYGAKPITQPGEAGAIGSYNNVKNGTIVTRGFLHCQGPPVLLDEINTTDKPLIRHLLTYLETGELQRGLKVPIHLKGTKTVILTANPSTKDLSSSLAKFITVVCTADEPARIGRRFGYLLLGNDYKLVKGQGDPKYRHETWRVIDTTVKQYRQGIQAMIESQLSWVMRSEPDIELEIKRFADVIPVHIAAEFVRGQSYGCIKKLKMAAIRFILLEQLDRVPDDTVDFSDRDKVFQRLLDINRDSWRKLACIKPEGTTDKEWVRELKSKQPDLGSRGLGSIVGVSHTTIQKWLRESTPEEVSK